VRTKNIHLGQALAARSSDPRPPTVEASAISGSRRCTLYLPYALADDFVPDKPVEVHFRQPKHGLLGKFASPVVVCLAGSKGVRHHRSEAQSGEQNHSDEAAERLSL
jgi:hypothetical protein